MPEITIATDTDTFNRWAAALVALRRPYTVPITTISPIVGITAPTAISTTAERLLLEIGRACSRPDILDDPGQLFAIFRYALAISDRYNVLTLREPFYRLDTHKKKVLSDEFGCGVALLLASELLGVSDVIDLETAAAYGWITTTATKSKRPDYICRLGNNDLVVLEAKGTQQGSRYARQQVTNGCSQVATVRIVAPSGAQITNRLASAISLWFEHWGPQTELFVGDPEEGDPDIYSFTDDPAIIARRLQYLRVAAFIGDTALATRLLEREIPRLPLPLVSQSYQGVSYVGTRLNVEGERQRISVFVGLESSLREHLLATLSVPPPRPTLPPAGAKLLYEAIEPFGHRDIVDIVDATPSIGTDGTIWVTSL